jgi:hypothetical protein
VNSGALRRRLVEGPNSVGERSRARRWATFASMFPAVGSYHVLDLGGTTTNWLRSPVRPASVTIVNLVEEPADGVEPPPWLTVRLGDACDPAVLTGGQDYDLVYSNSLLEHVGGHQRRLALAEVIHDGAPRHWIQTPYRYFPIEPHWLFPGLQFLPVALRAWILQRWPLANAGPASADNAVSTVLWTELVSRTEMRHYFPGSTLLLEKMGPLAKSLIAVRGGDPEEPSRDGAHT